MNDIDLLEQFCTPPLREDTDFDRKALAGAQTMDIVFENRLLKAYSMGAGRTVLLVHGWGSRASHLSPLARYLVKYNFHILIFDGPAHGGSKRKEGPDKSSMFEFGRAVSCLAKEAGGVYAVIGHSLGAIASAFTLLGTGCFTDYQVKAEKLVLLSTPVSIARIIENYCQRRNELQVIPELTRSLETTFHYKVSDYDLSLAIKDLPAGLLIVHDEQDEDIPVADALSLKAAHPAAGLFLTSGYGHKKILVNREVFQAVKDFLVE